MGKTASKLKKRQSYHNITLSRLGSLMSLKDRPLPRTPTDFGTNNNFYSVPKHLHTAQTTPATSPNTTPWTTPKNSPRMDRRSISSETDGGSVSKGSSDGPHMSIQQWLTALELHDQYQEVFDEFCGVEELLHFTEKNIKDLGVKCSAHRARIFTSLTALKEKYNRSKLHRKKMGSFRHSVAVDGGKKVRDIEIKEDFKVITDSSQSKSLCNLMDPAGNNDPNVDSIALRRALEWELSQDARELTSHAWYHGAIPRHRAEEIVNHDGEFLVRDQTSQPGNYVLTCRTRNQPLHFVINKVMIQPETVYERIQYTFEDDLYDTVPDLITFYVGSGKPISAASGARIQIPRNRMYPLSFYAVKYPVGVSGGTPTPSSGGSSRIVSPVGAPSPPFSYYRYSTSHKPSSSPTRLGKDAPPRLPSKKQRSQSLTPNEINRTYHEKCNSADGVIQGSLMTRSAGADAFNAGLKFSTHSLPRTTCGKMSLSPAGAMTVGRPPKSISRVTSDPSLSPCAERRHFGSEEDGLVESTTPPPKPSRIPSMMRQDSDMLERADNGFAPHGCLQRVASYHASGSDSGNGSGDSAQSSAAGDPEPTHKMSGVIIKNPRYHLSTSESTTTLKNLEFDYVEAEERLMQIIQPDIYLSSQFDLENFSTLLLPSVENKPLDANALRSIRMTLQETASRILANHLTRVDLDLIIGENQNDVTKLEKLSGIELCGLPIGRQLRMDLIERTECLKLLVAVTILTCANDVERAEVLNKWIEIAIDTKTALGNLFGFCGLMLGLCLPQIQKLNSTWHTLRQKYTDCAFNFEAKLRPTLKHMNECSNPQAPNTTIPHILPVILLQERTLQDFTNCHQLDPSMLTTTCISSWESHNQDFGLTTLLAHMDTARKFSDMVPTYRRNAEIVLGDSTRTEELILDTFKTEFHMKFLWGSRGALAPAAERHSKFEQILTVMANKFNAEEDVGTPV